MNRLRMDFSKWHTVLRSNLGPGWSTKHFDVIATSLEALNCGIKLAFLWDVGPNITPQKLSSLVQQLKRCSLLSESVHLVCIASDYVLVDLQRLLNRAGITERLSSESNDFLVSAVEINTRTNLPLCQSADDVALLSEKGRPIAINPNEFVDISKTLLQPVLIEQHMSAYDRIIQMISSVRTRISRYLTDQSVNPVSYITDNNSTDYFTLEIEDNWCVPTLFGHLVGYPVVYWFNVDYNNLCRVSLRVYKVYVERRSGRRVELYSFSVPTSLSTKVDVLIREWYESVKTACRDSGFGLVQMVVDDVVTDGIVL